MRIVHPSGVRGVVSSACISTLCACSLALFLLICAADTTSVKCEPSHSTDDPLRWEAEPLVRIRAVSSSGMVALVRKCKFVRSNPHSRFRADKLSRSAVLYDAQPT